MGLVKKRVTPKQLLAVRRNGHKSRGPRTEFGKRHSSLNALKDGAYAQVSLAHMQALGEDPADFTKHLTSLRRAFDPQDGVEEVLVAGIAQLYWRLFRLHRGEAGFLASRRRNLQAEREWGTHLARRAHANTFQDCATAVRGLVNSPDCPAKFRHILSTLDTVRSNHLLNGFNGNDSRTFDLIFGVDASCLGINLVRAYETCRCDFEKQPQHTQEYRREYFLKALNEEIEYFEREFEVYLQREVQVPGELSDAQLLPPTEDLDRIIRYESHLERLIEHKKQQLYERRSRKATVILASPIEVSTRVDDAH
ncbi:MAG TPA: hypothetical protein VKV95_07850 [Terriglobia bacterium]|nr:hypothetical protein [Terriglobia bacterium]